MSGVTPIYFPTYYPVNTTGTASLINNVKESISSIHMMHAAVSDMNRQKTGAYGGLLNAYYGKRNPLRPEKGVYIQFEEAANRPVALEVRERARKLEDTTRKLTGNGAYSVFAKDELRDMDGNVHAVYNKHRIYETLQDYAENYNHTLSSASASSDQYMKSAANTMKQLTSENRDDLRNIGITVDYNGRMYVNERKFMDADMANVTAVFGTQFGYAHQIGNNSNHMQTRISNMFESLTYNTYGRNGYYQGRNGPANFDAFA